MRPQLDPSKALLVQLNELKDVVLGGPACRAVPLRLITIVPLLAALLAITSWPVAAPVAAGENFRLTL